MSLLNIYIPQLWEAGGNNDVSQVNSRIINLESQISDILDTTVNKGGETMDGELNLGDHKITGLAEPTEDTDATTKAYVDGRVLKTGDSMTGSLSITSRQTTTNINHFGVLCSEGIAFVNLRPFGQSISIRQSTNAENSSGIRIANVAADRQFQMQWQDDGNFYFTRKNTGESSTTIFKIKNTRITAVRDPIADQDAANKAYVDSRKPVIAIWAEKNGRLSSNRYEWSFGDKAKGSDHQNNGYCMPTSGKIIAYSLTAVADTSQAGAINIGIVINGVTLTDPTIIKSADVWSSHNTLNNPVTLYPGDRINFMSKTTDNTVTACIVSLLIELDI